MSSYSKVVGTRVSAYGTCKDMTLGWSALTLQVEKDKFVRVNKKMTLCLKC